MTNPTFTRTTRTANLGNGQERRDWILSAGRCAVHIIFIGEARMTEQPDPTSRVWGGFVFGWHSQAPNGEGDKPHTNDCPHVEGGVCFFEGHTSRAEDLAAAWVAGGFNDEVIWAAAEQEMRERFIEPIDFQELMIRDLGDLGPDTL
ncbi:hypothetical protein ABZ897_51145 [Nonomuraea sp. NPDC046802]|uniref:hypothetical protein n=1 Tax=Nonomuraea sp. NPDC046802 TaxID=3154919 RepID=UPI0033FDDA33